MSDLSAIGLILATLVAGSALITYVSELLSKQAFVILTGLADGIPVSLEQRRMVLHRMYFQYLGGVIGLSVGLALGLLRIADAASDPDIKALAYVVAVLVGFPGCSWLVLGTWTGIDCVRAVRHAEAR